MADLNKYTIYVSKDIDSADLSDVIDSCEDFFKSIIPCGRVTTSARSTVVFREGGALARIYCVAGAGDNPNQIMVELHGSIQNNGGSSDWRTDLRSHIAYDLPPTLELVKRPASNYILKPVWSQESEG